MNTEASGIANVATQRIEHKQGQVETTDSRKAKQSWVHVLNPGCLVKNRKQIILRRTSSGTKKNPSPFQHHVGICAKWRDGRRAIDCLIGLRRLSQNSAGIAARSSTARISAGKAKGKKCLLLRCLSKLISASASQLRLLGSMSDQLGRGIYFWEPFQSACPAALERRHWSLLAISPDSTCGTNNHNSDDCVLQPV